MLISFAEKKLIKPGANDPRISARIGILHVDAGNAYDLEDYFRYRSGGIESHGHIPKDGKLFQYRDTDYEADANYLANPFALSFETQGYGSGQWNSAQLQTIKRTMIWCNLNEGIKLQVPKVWNGYGWGYHIQFDQWHPFAKACPGADRIEQYWDLLVPWMKVATVAIEDTILNRADRMLLSGNRIEEMLKELLTPAQEERARARSDAYAKTHEPHNS